MKEKEKEQREAIVKEYLSWLRTPYHHGARVKGVGVDCALIHAEVWCSVGLIPKVEVPNYPHDWHIHKNDELYLKHVLPYSRPLYDQKQVLEYRKTGKLPFPPLPADLVMYQYGRCTAHGAIVIDWPQILHSQLNQMVTLAEAFHPELVKNFRGVYRFKEWE